MKKRIHHKNFVPKVNKHNLNQIWFKINTNPRRFDFKEKKYFEYLKKMREALKEKINKQLEKVRGNNEVINQTA